MNPEPPPFTAAIVAATILILVGFALGYLVFAP